MRIGYARISTKSQDLSFQIDALKTSGCARVFMDQDSGTKTDRPGLLGAFSCAQEGDSLVVWKLDRLGRSLKDLVGFVEDLESRGIKFESLTDKIEISTPEGRVLFHAKAACAELECNLIAERTAAALRYKARRGEFTGGGVPYGYRLSDDGVHLVEYLVEQKVIAKARFFREKGLSLRNVAAELERQGMLSRTGKVFLAVQIRTMVERGRVNDNEEADSFLV